MKCFYKLFFKTVMVIDIIVKMPINVCYLCIDRYFLHVLLSYWKYKILNNIYIYTHMFIYTWRERHWNYFTDIIAFKKQSYNWYHITILKKISLWKIFHEQEMIRSKHMIDTNISSLHAIMIQIRNAIMLVLHN